MLIQDKHSGYLRGTRLCLKKDEAAPDPRMGEAALRQIEIAEKYWDSYSAPGGERDWLKGITEETLAIQRGTADKANEVADYQLDQMRFNDNRYRTNTIGYQDKLDAEIEELYSKDAINNRASAAGLDTGAAMDAAGDQMRRGLSRRGVNVNSGNFAAMENAQSLMRGQAVASASNKTRQAMEQAGIATKFQSLGAKLGLTGLGATNASLAMGGMGTGLQAAGGMNAGAAGMIGTNNNAMGAVQGGMSSGISSGMGVYNGKMNATGGDDGSAQLIGAAVGAAAAFFSDRSLKREIQLVGRTAGGTNLYRFKYLWDDTEHIGVMADEVPHAAIDFAGVKLVDYSMVP
jgi:hypothetical protein